MREIVWMYACGIAQIIDNAIMNNEDVDETNKRWGKFDTLFYDTFFKEEIE